MTIDASGTRVRLTEQVAEEIRALLARRRISGRELARRMGASYSWVNFRLTGAQEITLSDLQRFAEVLEVDYLDLLPQREGKLIAVGGAARATGGKLITATTALPKRPGPNGPRNRGAAPQTVRTGRVTPALAAA